MDLGEVSLKKYDGYDDRSEYDADFEKLMNGKICGAKTRGAGKMCNRKPMENGRCRLHGGTSPKGLDHPRTTHGGYSKYLPERVLEKYEEAQSNPDIMTLRNEMTLITARLYELAEKMHDSGGKEHYKKILHLYDRWQVAEKNDLKNKKMAKDNFEEILGEMEKDLRIWDEISTLVDTKRKLVDSEQRKMNNLQQFIPAEQVAVLMSSLMQIVVDEIEGLLGILVDEEQVEKSIRNVAEEFRKKGNKNGRT